MAASQSATTYLKLTSAEALMRTNDRMAILRHFCLHPGDSKQGLVEALPIPRSAIESRLRDLVHEGWLRFQAGSGPRTARGRPRRSYFVNRERLILFGAEVSDDRIMVLATTFAADVVAKEEVCPTPEDALACLTRMLLRMHSRIHSFERKVMGIGLGISEGFLRSLSAEDARLLSRAPGELLRGTSLGRVPVHVQSDVHAAALGEMEFGPHASPGTLIFLKRGSGIGGSVLKADESFSGDWRLARLVDSQSAIDNQWIPPMGESAVRIVIGLPGPEDGLAEVDCGVRAVVDRLSSGQSFVSDISLAQFGPAAVAMGAAALVRHRLARPDA